MPTLRKVYRFRLKPTRGQEDGLLRLAGSRRFIYNWTLARRNAHYTETGTTLFKKQLGLELTALKTKADTAWLRESDSQLLQQAVADVDRAFTNFFEGRAKYPRFKRKRRDTPSFRIPQRVKVSEQGVYIPKVGLVKLRRSQAVDLPTKSATFKREADGHWYVTLTAEFSLPDVPLPSVHENQVVGVDLGLKDLATLSTGERIEAPKFYRRAERRLRQAAKAFSRTTKGSKRRVKAQQKLARVHRRIANTRGDFLHKSLRTERVGGGGVAD